MSQLVDAKLIDLKRSVNECKPTRVLIEQIKEKIEFCKNKINFLKH